MVESASGRLEAASEAKGGSPGHGRGASPGRLRNTPRLRAITCP